MGNVISRHFDDFIDNLAFVFSPLSPFAASKFFLNVPFNGADQSQSQVG